MAGGKPSLPQRPICWTGPALQTVMEQLAAHLEWLDLPAKSRASHAAALLAGGRGPPGHLPPAEEEAQETFVIGFPGSPIPPPS